VTIKNRHSRLLCLLLCLPVLAMNLAQAAEPTLVKAYSYQRAAPFVRDEARRDGLNFALVEALNAELETARLELELLPRRRLDREMREPEFEGLVLLVAPHWFGDPEMRQFLWSEPLLEDANLVVSHRDRPIHYRSVVSLNDRVVGGIQGYRYEGVDLRAKAGWLRRVDVGDEQDLLKLLGMRSVDAIFISRLCFEELAAGNRSLWHVADTPHQRYQRRLLMSPSLSWLKPELERAIVRLRSRGWPADKR
jgi:hypothetical protein